MYNWIESRKFSGSRNLPAISFISKTCIPFIKNAFELNDFNRLPVIKEEEGNLSEEEVNTLQNYSQSTSSKTSHESQTTISTRNSSKDSFRVAKFNGSKPFTKLPPLVNVNCLMNADIKQTQSIWHTKFGKRLIYGKNLYQDLSGVEETSFNDLSSLNEKIANNIPSKTFVKQRFLQDNNIRSRGGNKHSSKIKGSSKCLSSGKKTSKLNNFKQNSLKKELEECENEAKSSPNIRTKSREELLNILSNQPQKASSTVFSLSRNQHFLTECVQTILDGSPNEFKCKHCNDICSNTADLWKHEKQHEAHKEVCLLCGKEFFNPTAFVEHLFTHEGVDRFSCKKCRKYFHSLQKYKQHCLNYHFTPSLADCQNQNDTEYVKKWQLKFECRRCKIEFDSEEQHVAHRRNHVKMDLTGAYLLSSKKFIVD